MNKSTIRQHKLLQLLKSQGVGVINISNEKLSALMSVTTKTIQRDINEMADKSIIVKETNLIKIDGTTLKQRDIIVKGDVIEELGYISWKVMPKCWHIDAKEEDVFASPGQEGKWVKTGVKEKPIINRRFTLSQHKQLRNKDNHKIYTNKWGEVIWNRLVDGVWERNIPEKEFSSEQQAYAWLYGASHNHNKVFIEGENYTSRSGIND